MYLFATEEIMKKQISFDVSARTAKLIGKENFANANGAVIELIKNSYDADATVAMVIFYKDALYIVDNWSWMTEEIIINNWMKIGTDNKQITFQTEGKRIKSWAKWIWRFALDRLWKVAEMYTKDKHSNVTNYWKVNWEQFNTSASISQVKAHLESLNYFDLKQFLLSEIPNLGEFSEELNKTALDHWTIFKLTGLNDDWDITEVDSLFQNLEMLIPPFNEINFLLFLYSDKKRFWKVKTAFCSDFDYYISAKYIWWPSYTLEVEIVRNELDIKKIQLEYPEFFTDKKMQEADINIQTLDKGISRREISLLTFPWFSNVDKNILNQIWPFSFSFYFLKNKNTNSKYPYRTINYSVRKNRLDKFWWIKIFRDNFRVRPYWEDWYDRLLLWERQAQSPQWSGQRIGDYRIRPNQISGIVNISRVSNKFFEDKSGREGIVENDAFKLFKNILINIIWIFEEDRNLIMYTLNELRKKKDERETKKEEWRNAVNEVKKKEEEWTVSSIERALKNATEILQEEIEEKNQELMMLRHLASIGLIVSTFSHELKNLKNLLGSRGKELNDVLHKYIDEEQLNGINPYENPFYLISLQINDDKTIKHRIDLSLWSLQKDKRERKITNIFEYLDRFKSAWSTVLEKRKIEMILNFPSEYLNSNIKCFTADLDSIFNNLLSNSIEALIKSKKPKKRIIISAEIVDEYVYISFEDNWEGLVDEFKNNPEHIFNPFITSKVDKRGNKIGTGLWMYIILLTIHDYKDAQIEIKDFIDKFTVCLKFKLYQW